MLPPSLLAALATKPPAYVATATAAFAPSNTIASNTIFWGAAPGIVLFTSDPVASDPQPQSTSDDPQSSDAEAQQTDAPVFYRITL